MATQAPAPVVGDFLGGGGQSVGVVTGDTAQLPGTGAKTAAPRHLRGMATGLPVLVDFGRPKEHRQEQVQGQAGPVIEKLPTAPDDPAFALQMTLLTNCIAQVGL